MRTLRFHSEIYSAEALERAEEVFRVHARLERRREGPYLLVFLESTEADSEQRLAGEFANYALALTAEQRSSGG